MLDWETLREWGAFLFMLGTALFAWFTRYDRATQESLKLAAAERAAFDKRITVLETKINDLPTRDDFHSLQRGFDQLSGDVKVVAERLKPIAATSERLQEILLQGGR